MPSLPRRRLVLIGALASGLVPAVAFAGGSVRVTMDEYTLRPSPKSVTAGKVTFTTRNAGENRHELVVLKTSKSASRLPQRAGRASEAGRVGAARNIAGGTSRSLTLRLLPGHYVLLCNIPGHYAGGMRADFTVR